MSNYKRIYLSEHCYFFTAVTHKRTPILKSPDHVQLLRDAFRYVKERRSFDLLAASVMPDHIHCMWRMPEGDSNYSVRWQMLKTAFSRKIRKKQPGKKYGNRVFGSMLFETKRISSDIWMSSITTRLSTDYVDHPVIGSTAHFSAI